MIGESTLFYVIGPDDLVPYDEGWDKLAVLHGNGWGIGDIKVEMFSYGLKVSLVLERSFDGLMPEVIDAVAELRKPWKYII